MYDKQLNNLSSDSLLCFLKRKKKKKKEKKNKSNLRKKDKKCKRSKSSYAINLLQAMVW